MNPITTAIDHAGFRTAFIRRMIASHERQSFTRMPRRLPLSLILVLALSAVITSSSHAQDADKQQRFDRLLKRFPDADTNQDGKLSQEEAKAYIAIGHGVMVPAFSYTGDTKENTGVTKYASDKCDKTSDVWDWLFSKRRIAATVRSEETPDAPKAAEKPTASEVPATRKGKIKGQEGEKRGARLEPTHADVSYGDHIRQKFDVWLPVGKGGPVPVHVYFHGGGFVGGKKTDFDPRPFVNAGFAAVSGSYRLLDGVNTLGPVPMQDGARVIQAVRLHAAKWNIDPARISVSGSSAGAVIAMWIGYHDDLAQPDSDDPIARQSSRVKCIVPLNGPTNMDPIWIRSNLGGPPEIHPTMPKMFGASDGFDRPEVRARIQASNPWEMVSADDPPTLLMYARDTEPMPLAATVGTSYLIHHPQFGVALKKKLDDTGIANQLHTGVQHRQGNTLIVNWLKTQFE